MVSLAHKISLLYEHLLDDSCELCLFITLAKREKTVNSFHALSLKKNSKNINTLTNFTDTAVGRSKSSGRALTLLKKSDELCWCMSRG